MTDNSSGPPTQEPDSIAPGPDPLGSSAHDRAPASPTSERRAAALTVGVIAAFVVIGLIGAAVVTPDDDAPSASTTVTPSRLQVETFPTQEQTHVDGPVDYAQMPPVGGPHADAWQNCGFYPEAVAAENAVHSMEHGAVWVTYSPDLSSDDQDALRTLAAGNPYVLVSPLADLDEALVLSAWTKQLRLDAFNSSQVEAFVTEFAQGPQTPEPGAPCTGGVGQPSS